MSESGPPDLPQEVVELTNPSPSPERETTSIVLGDLLAKFEKEPIYQPKNQGNPGYDIPEYLQSKGFIGMKLVNIAPDGTVSFEKNDPFGRFARKTTGVFPNKRDLAITSGGEFVTNALATWNLVNTSVMQKPVDGVPTQRHFYLSPELNEKGSPRYGLIVPLDESGKQVGPAELISRLKEQWDAAKAVTSSHQL